MSAILLGTTLAATSCDFGVQLDLNIGGPTGPIAFPLSITMVRHAVGVGDTVSAWVFGGGGPLVWSSLSPSVATVSADGIVTGLSAGTAIIRAVAGAEAAQTSLTVVQHICRESSVTDTIALGDSVAGVLDPTTCSIAYDQMGSGHWPPEYPFGYPDARQAAGWRLILADTTPVRFDVTSAAFHPAILVTDSTGWLIAADHRILSSMHVARILAPGPYTLWAASPGLTATGAYTLSAAEVRSCTPSDTVGAIAIGETLPGALTLTDCYEMNYGFLAEWRTLPVPASTAIRVRVLNETTLPMMIIADPANGRTVIWGNSMVYAVTDATVLLVGVASEFPGTYSLAISTCILPCAP